MACKKRHQNQIVIFDAFQLDERQRIFQNPDGNIRNFNVTHEITEEMQIHIHSNHKQIVYTDQHEKLVLEMEAHGYFRQRFLYNLEGKNVLQTVEGSNDFYFLSCDGFDNSLQLAHSTHESMDIAFKRQVEPGIIKVHDLTVREDTHEEPRGPNRVIRMLSMRDSEFILDAVEYCEVALPGVKEKEAQIKNQIGRALLKRLSRVKRYQSVELGVQAVSEAQHVV